MPRDQSRVEDPASADSRGSPDLRTPPSSRDITRRRFLRDAGVGAVGVGVWAGAAGAQAQASRRIARPGPHHSRRLKVAIFGGGVAGLSAAHELVERGFQVTVFERRAWGGKARSIDVPKSAAGGRRPLPGEHGARFFPGFYEGLPNTMERIPLPGGGSAFDNVITAPQERFARAGGREDFNAAFYPDPRPWTVEQLRETLISGIGLAAGIPPQEAGYFVDRLLVYFSSCDARRFGQLEHKSWWEFTAAAHFSEDYQRMLVQSITRLILAARAQQANARTLGLIWQAGLYNLLDRTGTGAYDRVLNAPTNEAWIDPWIAHLSRRGVRFHLGARLEELEVDRGQIAAAYVRDHRGPDRVSADWYVLAVPVERALRLCSRRVLAAAPQLAELRHLVTRWMNGLQFYLRNPTPIVHGHVLYIDSPWALASISQAQFWNRSFAQTYGDGRAHDCISVDIGDFGERGILFGKPARSLAPHEIARECWAQMKAHLNDTGRSTLRDEEIVGWFLDPGLVFKANHRAIGITNQDPLLISTPGSWEHRPNAATAIPNLFLAADYVRVNVDTACMEGANEAGRRATNAILQAAHSRASEATLYPMYEPPEFRALRQADQARYASGQPNVFDVPPPPATPSAGR